MRSVAVILPDLGIGPDEPIVVSHWFYRRGEEVWEGDRLVEVLVGAATFDVPAPASGRLTEIRCQDDDPVRPGQVLGILGVDAGSLAPPSA
jgi:pyruvate/2-oxoglutarate dehydrogenase complex dihydrolipoamide acyltransferase (E2) component